MKFLSQAETLPLGCKVEARRESLLKISLYPKHAKEIKNKSNAQVNKSITYC